MCCATKRVPSIVFSTSRSVGLSNVGLMPSTTQHDGLSSPFPVGLNSSSSPPGNGNAGNGGSPKQGPTPPDAATSNLDGITKPGEKQKIWNEIINLNSSKWLTHFQMSFYLASHSRWCCNHVWIYLRLEGNEIHRLTLLVDRYHHRVVDCLF